MRVKPAALAMLLMMLTSLRGSAADPVTGTNVFDQEVAPIFAEHCLECHQGAEPSADLDLSQRVTTLRGGESGPAIMPGNLQKSLVWSKIATDSMPPNHALLESEKKVIRVWIANGAKWGSDPIDPFRHTSKRRAGYDWWSLQPLSEPSAPQVDDDRWSINDIDRFIFAELRDQGLVPSPRADPRTLVRRLYIDLIGLPPAPEVIDQFEENPSAAAWELLVDELLASKHYGERWARHWLDIVRFGESDGYEYNSPRETAWHYRDWIIRALNADMPYDEFTRMQLAGDILKPGTLEGAAAVGLLVAGTHNTVPGNSPAMKAAGRHDELEEIAGTVAQTFLGLTINCARCHDHKFDPITTREYYSFIAALDGVRHGERRIRIQTAAETDGPKLTERIDALRNQLADLVFARGGLGSTSANQVRTKSSIGGNEKGKTYRVSFKLAPSVWAAASQATGASDGVNVSILREDGSVLAAHASKAGVWSNGANDRSFQSQTFDYVGDGDGRIHIHLRPFPLHANRFGGAIDDLRISEVGSKTLIFEESFDGFQQRKPSGSQADTSRPVFFLADSDRWDHTGINTIHMVEHTDGDFALQLFSGYGKSVETMAKTRAELAIQREIETLDKQIGNLPTGTLPVHSVTPSRPAVMRLLVRGDVTRPAEEVIPGGVRAVKSVPASFHIDKSAPDAERRMALGRWISNRDNGPFHRVIVNRIWHYHFGQGIVTSPSDFGFNGGRPSHPELLDWLAVWFRANDYSLKKLHKLMVTSATYQQSSLSNARGSKSDAENRFLWRQNTRRVEAEVLRDSMLVVAGQLNRKSFGPGYHDVKIVTVPPANYYLPIDPVGDEFNRRTIYRWNVRGRRSALLDTFDCPDPSTKTPNRMVTTTPSQALSHWNHPFVLRMSTALAHRIAKESKGSSDHMIEHQVNRAWRIVLGRWPTAGERSQSLRLASRHGLPLLCRVLLNSNEFVLID